MPGPQARLSDLMAKFRARGGRMTPQRMAIFKALLAEDHPTVERIYEAVRRDFPMTSLVTVYRTVARLKEWGEVLEVDSGESETHYDGLRCTQHPHLVCIACGRVADSPDVDLKALTEDLNRRAGNWALSLKVHFYGVCPECQASKSLEGKKGG
jgi:Fur family peroxide stress response transcriptional regulator